MSKKLLLETITWLDSLHIVDKNTEFDVYSSRYRGPSNNIQGLNYPRTQDAESDEDKECVADIREYRRQSKDYSFKKWIRWIEHRRKRAKRYSKHLNNKFIATKSKLMLSSACIQVTISTWQTFCCIAKGIQQWKNFVQRKKKYRLQYSLYRALRNFILHIGPKITQRNSYQFKSSSVEWLTKNYQLRMMLKYWKISTTFHKNKKTNIFHIWHKKYLACMKLHHMSKKFEKVFILVCFFRWKKVAMWWSIMDYRRRFCLHKAIGLWKNSIEAYSRLNQADNVNVANCLYWKKCLRQWNLWTDKRLVLKKLSQTSERFHHREVLTRHWRRVTLNLQQKLYSNKSTETAKYHWSRLNKTTAIAIWKKRVNIGRSNRRYVKNAHSIALRRALLNWFYVSCLPPSLKSSFDTQEVSSINLPGTAANSLDSMCKILFTRVVQMYRLWNEKRMHFLLEQNETSAIIPTQNAKAISINYFRRKSVRYRRNDDHLFTTINPTIDGIPSIFHLRNYEVQAHHYYFVRQFRSFSRRLRVNMLLRNHLYQHRIFRRIRIKKYMLLWKYRFRYTHHPQRVAYSNGKKFNRLQSLHRYFSIWFTGVKNDKNNRQIQQRLVRYHRLSYAFQKLWYDQYHIKLKWVQTKVYMFRAQLHYQWNKQQRHFKFWAEWAKSSRKLRICLQAFKNLYPTLSTSKRRQLLQRIFYAWYTEYVPYAKTLTKRLDDKVKQYHHTTIATFWGYWYDCFERRIIERVKYRSFFHDWLRYAKYRSHFQKRSFSLIESYKISRDSFNIQSLPQFYITHVYGCGETMNFSSNHHCGISTYLKLYCQRFYFSLWTVLAKYRKSKQAQYLQNRLKVFNQIKEVRSSEQRLKYIWEKRNLLHAFCAWQQVQTLRMERIRMVLIENVGRKCFVKWIKHYNHLVMKQLLLLPPRTTLKSPLKGNQQTLTVQVKDEAKHKISKKKRKILIGDMEYMELRKDMYRNNAQLSMKGVIDEKSDSTDGDQRALDNTRHEILGGINRDGSTTRVLVDISNKSTERFTKMKGVSSQNDAYHMHMESSGKIPPPPPILVDDKDEPSVFSGNMSELSLMTEDSLNMDDSPIDIANYRKASIDNRPLDYSITKVGTKVFSARVYQSTVTSRIREKFSQQDVLNISDKSSMTARVAKLEMDGREMRSKANSYMAKFEDLKQSKALPKAANNPRK